MAQAQRNPTLADLEDMAKSAKSAASEYLKASQSSFLQKELEVGSESAKKSFLAPAIRPLIARVMGESGPTGQYERKTQSPMVFLHLHRA